MEAIRSQPDAAPGAFLPAAFDPSTPALVEPFVRNLLDRPVRDTAELERWLIDRADLDAATSEAEAVRYIAMTCRTDDAQANAEYERFVRDTQPDLRRWANALDRRQAELFDAIRLPAARYAVLDRDVRNEAALFREANVALHTELATMAQEYERILGGMTVHFDGRERTMSQMGAYFESPDRAVRERAWRAATARRLEDKHKLESLFDRMLPLRQQIAMNAGLPTYLEYAFRSKRRFDYTPADCVRFHDAVESRIMPLLRERDERRRRRLGFEVVRPWDAAVDPDGDQPLRPFTDGPDLEARSARVFQRLDPRLAGLFEKLRDGSSLDLDSRPGKAPGGYQYMRDRSRRPFIFMNAAGMHRDVRTMVHEAGHAFHSLLTNDEPLLHYRHSVYEFAEVASMAMELLTMPCWDEFYANPAERKRAQREQLESIVYLLPWVATIDAFQHWIYTHPGHTGEARRAEWMLLHHRFGRVVDWSGLDEECAYTWHRQPHIFTSPFYYIEYGIAQIGALQLWLRSLDEGPRPVLDDYIRALSLGGSRTLPELFDAAGIKFDFGDDVLARLADALRERMSALDA